jgi:hypothetical protein
MVRLYEVNGDHYLDIPKWLEHQRIDRPSRSRIPEFVEPSRALVEPSRSLDVGREGKGREGKGIENRPPPPNKETHPELFRWLKGCDKFLADKKFMASISELMTNISTSHPDMDFWSLPQKAHSWLVANPHKPRKHLLAFFRNWVNRQAEGWPNKNSAPLRDSDAGVGIQPLPDGKECNGGQGNAISGQSPEE